MELLKEKFEGMKVRTLATPGDTASVPGPITAPATATHPPAAHPLALVAQAAGGPSALGFSLVREDRQLSPFAAHFVEWLKLTSRLGITWSATEHCI